MAKTHTIDRLRHRSLSTLIFLAFMLTPVVAISAQSEHPHLPPRPQPAPTPTEPRPNDADDTGAPRGARIELLPIPPLPNLWTEVEWQDGEGQWHTVPGWRGSYNRTGRVSWFVDQKDFGKGPFRWVVTETEDGEIVGSSEPFYLPGSADEVLRVEVVVSSPL